MIFLFVLCLFLSIDILSTMGVFADARFWENGEKKGGRKGEKRGEKEEKMGRNRGKRWKIGDKGGKLGRNVIISFIFFYIL